MSDPSLASRQACEEALSLCACLNFRKASRAVTQLFDQTLQPSGLRSTQFAILASIHRIEPATISALARDLVLDRTSLTRNIKPLERSGLIQARQRKGRQPRLLTVTEKGRDLLKETIPLWRDAQRRFIGRFGQDRWDGVRAGLHEAVDAARLA